MEDNITSILDTENLEPQPERAHSRLEDLYFMVPSVAIVYFLDFFRPHTPLRSHGFTAVWYAVFIGLVPLFFYYLTAFIPGWRRSRTTFCVLFAFYCAFRIFWLCFPR